MSNQLLSGFSVGGVRRGTSAVSKVWDGTGPRCLLFGIVVEGPVLGCPHRRGPPRSRLHLRLKLGLRRPTRRADPPGAATYRCGRSKRPSHVCRIGPTRQNQPKRRRRIRRKQRRSPGRRRSSRGWLHIPDLRPGGRPRSGTASPLWPTGFRTSDATCMHVAERSGTNGTDSSRSGRGYRLARVGSTPPLAYSNVNSVSSAGGP